MKRLLRFNPVYFAITLILFAIEILIAKFAHDQIIRPYVGDLLVVILLYCFTRSFLNTAVLKTAIAVLLFSYTIEILQYCDIAARMGLQRSGWASIVIGNSFAWMDLLAYTIGAVLVIIAEKKRASKKESI